MLEKVTTVVTLHLGPLEQQPSVEVCMGRLALVKEGRRTEN